MFYYFDNQDPEKKKLKKGRYIMEKNKKIKFISDDGHGWAKVTKKELERLGIADKVSGCSYTRGEYAYLEEDCDMGTFLDARFARCGTEPTIIEVDRDWPVESHPLRQHRRWCPRENRGSL